MFLEVITRTFGKRPRMLLRNVLSMREQTDADWQQTLLHDTERRGVAWAVGNLATVEAVGDYVWILDDDDECAYPEFVADLKYAVTIYGHPDVVMVKMDHGEPLGVLPATGHWGNAPQEGCIGTSAFVVRRDVWNMYRPEWRAQYNGDFHFIRHLWDVDCIFAWLDVVASRTQSGRNMGAAE